MAAGVRRCKSTGASSRFRGATHSVLHGARLKQIYFSREEYCGAADRRVSARTARADARVAARKARHGICLFLMKRYEEAIEELAGYLEDSAALLAEGHEEGANAAAGKFDARRGPRAMRSMIAAATEAAEGRRRENRRGRRRRRPGRGPGRVGGWTEEAAAAAERGTRGHPSPTDSISYRRMRRRALRGGGRCLRRDPSFSSSSRRPVWSAWLRPRRQRRPPSSSPRPASPSASAPPRRRGRHLLERHPVRPRGDRARLQKLFEAHLPVARRRAPAGDKSPAPSRPSS